MKKLKIGSRFMLISSILIVLTITIISSLIGQQVYIKSLNHAKTITKESAYGYSNLIKSFLDKPLNEIRDLVTVLETTISDKSFRLNRRKTNLLLYQFIQRNRALHALGVAFEPNAYDGNDKNFINAPGHDETGRFIPYWDREESGIIHLIPMSKKKLNSERYQIPYLEQREFVSEPYLSSSHNIKNETTKSLLVSGSVPINKNGNVVGIAMSVLELKYLQSLVQDTKITMFPSASIHVLSSNGVIVASNLYPDDLGKPASLVFENEKLLSKLKYNEAFSIDHYNKKFNGDTIGFAAPLDIGLTGQTWMITVEVPKKILLKEADLLVSLIGLIGLAAILIMLLFMYSLTQSLVIPLAKINQQLKIFAEGQLEKTQEIEYLREDEIKEIITSISQLQTSMGTTIYQAKAISEGDFSCEVKLLSEHDQLGQALANMLATLRGVITQAKAIAAGDYSQEVKLLSEHDQLGQALSEMTVRLREITHENTAQNWLKSGLTELNKKMSGEQELLSLVENIINFLPVYIDAQVGAFYLLQSDRDDDTEDYLAMLASYAYTWRKHGNNGFYLGEGLVGQAALECRTFIITEPPDDYIHIESGLGATHARNILILPFLYENELRGVIELASMYSFTKEHLNFLDQAASSIGIAIHTAQSREKLKELLQQSQAQSEALKQQQDTLAKANETLLSQTEELQSQSEELQVQQEELRGANEALEIRNQEMLKQKQLVEDKNADLENAKFILQKKAEQLELASKYKSEFLANMSHELRTPLNSLLILAQLLADNKENTLTEKQTEYAKTIYNSGADLLHLINEILDLSKIESGKLAINFEEVSLNEIKAELYSKFHPMAGQKDLQFDIDIEPQLPASFYTDSQRLIQIITNLLSNAIKFTSKGSVRLNIMRPNSDTELKSEQLQPSSTIAFQVVDTGIGIPEEKQKVIFEAFQQADGTTSRKFGGTGLGLSISRQLVELLGGEIQLHSMAQKGSTFSIYLPEHTSETGAVSDKNKASAPIAQSTEATPLPHLLTQHTETQKLPDIENETAQDSELTQWAAAEKSLLIIEDDNDFARLLIDLASDKGFQSIHASDGQRGLDLAKHYVPSAIMLDIGLPLVDGWSVMEHLKENAATRHIPVHFVSGTDHGRDARRMGAIGYSVKPANLLELGSAFDKIEDVIQRKMKNLLLISANPLVTENISRLLSNTDIQVFTTANAETAKTPLQAILIVLY